MSGPSCFAASFSCSAIPFPAAPISDCFVARLLCRESAILLACGARRGDCAAVARHSCLPTQPVPLTRDLEVEKEVWTPLRLLKWTAEYFKKRGVEEPRLDAELLLAKALGVERIMLYAGFERIVTDEELARFRESVKERIAGRPAKYIVGRTEFYSLPFKVDERVLVPRAETELLVERTIDLLEKMPGDPRPVVVELGTGSGAVAVAVASRCRAPRYIATDISGRALEVARENAVLNGVADAVEFVEGDLLRPVEPLVAGGSVSIVVSNPPYVKAGDLPSLPKEIREYEPTNALVAGPAGTEVHERILDEAGPFLRSGGALLMEMDNDQKRPLEEIAARHAEYTQPVFHQDFANLYRVIELRKV
jgi:release factor glutamine methyltransferase